jgi:photosynthetic reaction center cytochrome c subunit
VIKIDIKLFLIAAIVVEVFAIVTFEKPGSVFVQQGYRGLGIQQLYQPAAYARLADENAVPEALPKEDLAGQPASAVYQNVQVLGDVDANEFLRIMNAITAWVAPEQGCTYCHAEDGFVSDTVYTKVVARRMLQMTKHLNQDWKDHTKAAGVTCYTCHRGQPVPKNVWFSEPPQRAIGMTNMRTTQNAPKVNVGLTSLPYDVNSPYLLQANDIRVQGTEALPYGNQHSTKQTEYTYGLMVELSQALGVNCTYCHNSRAFENWSQSSPQRVTAWHGIRMVRDLNSNYLVPLTATFPAHRLGPTGDVAKINCATCHNGVFKPLFGKNMVDDYPALLQAKLQAP